MPLGKEVPVTDAMLRESGMCSKRRTCLNADPGGLYKIVLSSTLYFYFEPYSNQ